MVELLDFIYRLGHVFLRLHIFLFLIAKIGIIIIIVNSKIMQAGSFKCIWFSLFYFLRVIHWNCVHLRVKSHYITRMLLSKSSHVALSFTIINLLNLYTTASFLWLFTLSFSFFFISTIYWYLKFSKHNR